MFRLRNYLLISHTISFKEIFLWSISFDDNCLIPYFHTNLVQKKKCFSTCFGAKIVLEEEEKFERKNPTPQKNEFTQQ